MEEREAVAGLLVELYNLALCIGWRWDGERWVRPGEEGYEECAPASALRVGLGQAAVVQVPQPAHLGCGSQVAVSRGAAK